MQRVASLQNRSRKDINMRRLSLRMLAIIIIGQAIWFSSEAYSSDFGYELSGVFYLQPTYFDIRNDNWLNPENEILNFPDYAARLYPRVKFDLHYKKLKFITQTQTDRFC